MSSQVIYFLFFQYAMIDTKKSYVHYISHELRTPLNTAFLGIYTHDIPVFVFRRTFSSNIVDVVLRREVSSNLSIIVVIANMVYYNNLIRSEVLDR